jgi:hypothetical protein
LIQALLLRKNTNYCPQIARQTLKHGHIHVSLLFDMLQHYRSSFYFNEWRGASTKEWNLHPHCARTANHKQTLPQWCQLTPLHSVHDYNMFKFMKFIITVTLSPPQKAIL